MGCLFYISSLLVPRVWMVSEWGTPLSDPLPVVTKFVSCVFCWTIFISFSRCTLTYFSCSCSFLSLLFTPPDPLAQSPFGCGVALLHCIVLCSSLVFSSLHATILRFNGSLPAPEQKEQHKYCYGASYEHVHTEHRQT